jgi:hypothetical protein
VFTELLWIKIKSKGVIMVVEVSFIVGSDEEFFYDGYEGGLVEVEEVYELSQFLRETIGFKNIDGVQLEDYKIKLSRSKEEAITFEEFKALVSDEFYRK